MLQLILHSSTGQDRLLRLVQSVVRLNGLEGSQYTPIYVEILNAFRMTRMLALPAYLRGILSAFPNEDKGILPGVLKFLKSLGYTGFVIGDMTLYLYTIKLLRPPTVETIARIRYIAMHGILMTMVCSLLDSTIHLAQKRLAQNPSDTSKHESNLEGSKNVLDRHVAEVSVLVALCEVIQVAAAMGYVKMGDKVVGVLGVLAGIWRLKQFLQQAARR